MTPHKLVRVSPAVADVICNSVEELPEGPADGTVAHVLSYYSDTSGAGGGLFTYNSALAGTDNGFTIIRGWVRQRQQIYTPQDAGILPGTGADTLEKMQAMVNLLPGNCTLKIRGTYNLSGPLKLEGLPNIYIDGLGGKLTSKALRSSYRVLDYARTNVLVMMTGLLSAFQCPRLTVKGLEIEGCVKMSSTYNADGTVIGEEHGIFLRSCDGAEVCGAIVHNVFGYGVLGWFQSDVVVYNSYFYDIVRESGVNVVSGGGYAKIYGNTFTNIGLYGVEVEGHPYLGDGMSNVEVWGNVITDTRMAIPVVDACRSAKIFGNRIIRAHTGITSYRTYNYSIDSISFSDNVVLDSLRGIFNNNAKNTEFNSNFVSINTRPSFLYTSSFNNAYEVDSSDRKVFWAPYNSQFASLIGKNILWRGVVYNVTAAVWDSTKTGYPKDLATDPDGLLKVTLDKELPEEASDTVPIFMTDNFTDSLAYQSSGVLSGTSAKGNTLVGYDTALLLTSTKDVDSTRLQEVILDNDIRDCTTYFTKNSAYGHRQIDNAYVSGILSSATWTSASMSEVIARKSRDVHLADRTASTSNTSAHFYSPSAGKCLGFEVNLLNWSSTGTLQVSLNGSVVVGSGTYTSGSLTTLRLFTQANILAGDNVLQFNSSDNSLLYQSCVIRVIII